MGDTKYDIKCNIEYEQHNYHNKTTTTKKETMGSGKSVLVCNMYF